MELKIIITILKDIKCKSILCLTALLSQTLERLLRSLTPTNLVNKVTHPI